MNSNPIEKLRSLVSRQDENENCDNIEALYAQLREAVIKLFKDPQAEV